MSNKQNDELYDVLIDLGRTTGSLEEFNKRGPSRWLEIKDDSKYYGPQEDYKIVNDNVFFPVSEAALQWCYFNFPEHAPRSGVGFVVDEGLDKIIEKAKTDKLMSRKEFEEAMNEQQEVMRQWEQ